MPTPPLDDDILRETVAAFDAAGSVAGAARALGLSWSAVRHRLTAAADRGLDGSTPCPAPVGQRIRGVSTLYGLNPKTGAMEPRAIWTKTEREGESPEALREALREALAGYRGLAEPAPPPRLRLSDLLTVYPLPDLHLGLKAWGRETGGPDYDLRIAKALIRDTLGELFAQTPASGTAVLLVLGDLTHADSEAAATPKSGNRLDVDSRHKKVRREAVRLLMWAIDAARQRHGRVIVGILPGNHDPETAGAVADCLALAYEREPRVEVDDDPGYWWALRHGCNMLTATHGHNIKPADMPGHISARWPRMWGETHVRRCFFGHVHHVTAQERHGARAESFPTITPPDGWHAEMGFSTAERGMLALTYHRTRGEVARLYAGIQPPAAEGAA